MTRPHPRPSRATSEAAADANTEAAARNYGYAESEANRAAHSYGWAADRRAQAAWLTAHPDLWHIASDRGGRDVTPATVEAEAANSARLGDIFLDAYWRYVDQARSHERLADVLRPTPIPTRR